MYDQKWSEDVTPGYFMGKIEVTDMDENAKQLFSLGGADAKYFMWSIEDFFATGQKKNFKTHPMSSYSGC